MLSIKFYSVINTQLLLTFFRSCLMISYNQISVALFQGQLQTNMSVGEVHLANGVHCICGNKDAVKFRQYRHEEELLGAYCLKCDREYLKKSFLLSDITEEERGAGLQLGKEKLYQAEKLDQTDSAVHMVHPKKTQIGEWNRKILKAGDHIAWQRPYIIWHHALVIETCTHDDKKVKVIHFSGTKKHNSKIFEEWIDLSKQSGTLYLVEYDDDVAKKNPTKLVIARARSRIDDSGYTFFGNNCEHFVTFCKKGVEKSQQVSHFMKVIYDQLKMALGNLVEKGLRAGIPLTMETVAKSSGKVFSAELIEYITKSCQWVGFGLVVGIEGYLTIIGLKDLYKSRKDGSLTRKDFLEQVSKRVTEAVLTMGLGGAGGLLTGFLGLFIGIIGAFVGKLVGAWLGPRIGKALTSGMFDDRAVETIDALHEGDHIVFYGNPFHPRHHCIVLWHDEENDKVNVIHSTYEFGVKQEWIKYKPPFYKVIYKDGQCLPPHQVLERATSKLGSNDYNLFTYNCKDFAQWCKGVDPKSKGLQLGDQIVCYGNILHPRHHCIVLWHEEEKNLVNVIHNTYESGVKQEWIELKPPFNVVTYREDQCLPAHQVLGRAISKLGSNDYNLLTYNCKDFAKWCKKK